MTPAEDCDTCCGEGVMSMCCGAPIDPDVDVCSKCHDSAGGGEACPDCHGTMGQHVYGSRMIASDPCIFCGRTL